MEMEEMKALWSEMSDQLEQQKKLTNEIIMTMTQERYSNKFSTISKYETVGAIFCYVIATYVLVNFGKLNSWFLQGSAVFILAFLIIQPILVLRALSKIKRLNILNKNYKETLVSYTKAKTNLLRIQQIGIAGGFIFMLSGPVFVKILTNKDFFKELNQGLNQGVYIIFVITLVLAVLVSIWGYRHYTRITNSAQSVIEELE